MKSSTMQVVHLWKKGKDFKPKKMVYYIKIIKLGFAGWFKKKVWVGEQKMGRVKNNM